MSLQNKHCPLHINYSVFRPSRILVQTWVFANKERKYVLGWSVVEKTGLLSQPATWFLTCFVTASSLRRTKGLRGSRTTDVTPLIKTRHFRSTAASQIFINRKWVYWYIRDKQQVGGMQGFLQKTNLAKCMWTPLLAHTFTVGLLLLCWL